MHCYVAHSNHALCNCGIPFLNCGTIQLSLRYVCLRLALFNTILYNYYTMINDYTYMVSTFILVVGHEASMHVGLQTYVTTIVNYLQA